MSPTAQQPQMNLAQTADYRESYANSVQVRVSVWDFQLVFGLASSESPEQVTIRNHQAIFLSPQQAKALWNVLGQNLAQYEQAFGTLNLEPQSHNFPAGTGELARPLQRIADDPLRWIQLYRAAAGRAVSRCG